MGAAGQQQGWGARSSSVVGSCREVLEMQRPVPAEVVAQAASVGRLRP